MTQLTDPPSFDSAQDDNQQPDDNTGPKKTMFNYILWYNDIELKEVEALSKVSYPIINKLHKGANHKFTYRTLETIAKALSLEVSDFYDWQKGDHVWFDPNS